jgi:hypothetical protein
MPVGQIRRRQVAELLHTITHERHAPRSSDVVRSLISRMFRFGIAAGHEDIEYNPAAGTERALDNLPNAPAIPMTSTPPALASSNGCGMSGPNGSAWAGRSWAGSVSCAR